MSNVVNFHKAQQSRESVAPSPPASCPEAMEMSSRVASLQSKAKEEIRYSILMLDLAALHARELARRMHDPAMKANFDARIETIEQLIQLARDMAVNI